jgi:membrane protease YdiL (CAAX protease family)
MMSLVAPIFAILAEILKLFRGRSARLSWLLLAALGLQTAYWYLGSPGPVLLGERAPGLESALANIGWAVLLFLVLPLLLLRVSGISAREAGLQLGDVSFGFKLTIILSLIALPVLYLGAQDPALQAAYPWAGSWPGASLANLMAWAGLYALYYLAYEFFFRGFLVRVITPHWGLVAAIWVQALASALIHLGKPPLETLGTIPLGLVFALFAIKSRSILWPALFHLVIGMTADVFSLHHQGLLLP